MFNIRSKGFTMSGGALTTVFLSSPIQCSAKPPSSFCEYLKKYCCCCPGMFDLLYNLWFRDNNGYKEVRGDRYEGKSYSKNVIANQEITILRKSNDSDDNSGGEDNNINNNKYNDNESEENNNINNNKYGDAESIEENNINNKYSGEGSEEEEEVGETKEHGKEMNIVEKLAKLKNDKEKRWSVFFEKMNDIYLKATGNSLMNDVKMCDKVRSMFSSFKSGDDFNQFCMQSCEQFVEILKNPKEEFKLVEEIKCFTNEESHYE